MTVYDTCPDCGGERLDYTCAGCLCDERDHFARVAWWMATHQPGQEVPSWAHVAWSAGEPLCTPEEIAGSLRWWEGEEP